MDNLVALLGNRPDTAEILDFASKNSDRLVSDWVYAANTSNHGSYGAYTIALASVLGMPEFPSATATHMCRIIIKDELKTIYRALTMVRPAQTVPTITLLTHIVRFCSQELFNEFDFTLSVIRKLLSQQPFRSAFLAFYIELIQKSAGPVRRELVSNRKIVSLWFGKLGSDDDEKTVLSTLETLTKFVLRDTTNFTKSAKMGIFNDWTLKNFMKVLAVPEPPQKVVEEMSKFIITLLGDKVYGVRMTTGGEQKLSLSFLKIIKPWENVHQMDLVLSVLESSPELFVAYFDQLSSAFNLAPKASMWWVSFAVLHVRALKLNARRTFEASLAISQSQQPQIQPPHQANVDFQGPPQPPVTDASRAILPATVTKAHLAQALGSSQVSSFVRFQAAQIVLFTLRRLAGVIELVYKPRNWDPTLLIEDVVGGRLPEPSLFTKDTEPPLLRTLFCIILKEMGALRPLHSVTVGLNLDTAHEVKGLELVQAENLLEVQTYMGDQTKWWNPTKGTSMSLFTQLLKFATYNLSLADQSGQLLQNLVLPTQIFADIPRLASPVEALLFALSVVHSDVTWEVIEQAIQRVIKSPYQYIDKIKSDKVSPFIVALTEQYYTYFASKEVDEAKPTKKWLQLFGRCLAVLGEDEHIIATLLQISQPLSEECNGGGKDEYFNFVLDAKDLDVLQRKDILYKISNRLELAATISRIVHTPNEKVRNFLLANLPSDMLPVLSSEQSGFLPFFAAENRDLLKAFLVTIDGSNSVELAKTLEMSSNWDIGLTRLPTEFLESKLAQNIHTDNVKLLEDIISELTSRKIPFTQGLLSSLLSTNVNSTIIGDNLKLWNAHSISREEGKELLRFNDQSPLLIAQLVKISGFYTTDHPLSRNGTVLVAAAKYDPAQLDRDVALQTASELLYKGDSEGFSIIMSLAKANDSATTGYDVELNQSLSDAISGYIENSKSKLSQSVLHSDLVLIVASSTTPLSFLSRWLKIAVHQLTKRYAESKMFTQQYNFLSDFNSYCLGGKSGAVLNVWDHVNPNEINSLIEAIMHQDSHNVISLETVSRVSLQSSIDNRSSKLNSLAHISALLEKNRVISSIADTNTDSQIELADALCIFSLVTVNLEACSTQLVEQGILSRYSGSLTPKDRIYYTLLEKIESIRQRSWIDEVESWDVRPARAGPQGGQSVLDEYELDPLIIVKGSGKVFVTIDEQRIRETIQNFENSPKFLLESLPLDYDLFMKEIERYNIIIPNGQRAESLYDSHFLLNLVVSCEYLMDNLEVFFSSGLLSFVLCCLVDKTLRDTAINVLKYTFVKLNEKTFKDKVSMRLLIGKVLLLYTSESSGEIPSHIPVISGQIALVLANPNHFLYGMASKWLLSSPSIQHLDIPLSKSIFASQSDLKLREMVWLINSLKSGAVDESAVQSYVQSGTIEWALSQFRSLNTRSSVLRESIKGMLNRIEEVRHGSTMLITTSGGLSVPEIKQRLFYSAGQESVMQYAK